MFTNSFFCLIETTVKALYGIFQSSYCVIHSRICVWFIFWLLSLLNFLFSSCIVSWILLSCLCSLVAHWDSRRWLFWIFLSGSLEISISLGLVTGDPFCTFDGIMFPWLFVIPVALHWCLCIWRSRHLFQYLQPGFGRESPSPVYLSRDFEQAVWGRSGYEFSAGVLG